MLGTWPEGIAAVQRCGVRVVDPDGRRWTARLSATDDPKAVPPADVALVLVKSHQTARAAAWAARVLAAAGAAVTLQNGLDNAPKLAAVLGAGRVTAGVTYNGATLLGPGEVRHAVALPTHLGRTEATAALVHDLAGLLAASGLPASVTDEIDGLLWTKAVANAAINPLTALWRTPNGEVTATAVRRELLGMLARESAEVARALGIELALDDPCAYVESVAAATSANRSSMLQDVARGRPTEIDSINGVIVREGARLGVRTPANEVVWRLVRGIAAGEGEGFRDAGG